MTDCMVELSPIRDKKQGVLSFSAGRISTDTGVVLLRELDKKLGLTASFAGLLKDSRNPLFITHSYLSMVRQRVYQIVCGYEDCNDADVLRKDPVFKSVADSSPDGHDLASQETLSRFENGLSRQEITSLMRFFIRSWLSGPKRERVVLEFDGTDDPTHGQQQLSFYHGYYGQHMYHPLLVHDGETGELIVPLLRPGNVHGSKKSLGMLAWIVRETRRAWGADVAIEIRADAGFAIPKIYAWCERNGVTYVIGLVTNSSLTTSGERLSAAAKELFEKTGEKQRLFDEFGYKAGSWEKFRRVVVKAEHQEKGSNTRFTVTNRIGSTPQETYDWYVERGEQENRIKELKNDLKADRLSCHRFTANFFRLLLHSVAYKLMHAFRLTLKNTALEKAQTETIRRRLLKIGALVSESVRRVAFNCSASFVDQPIFAQAFKQIMALGS
jgi:hypothetical protein